MNAATTYCVDAYRRFNGRHLGTVRVTARADNEARLAGYDRHRRRLGWRACFEVEAEPARLRAARKAVMPEGL